MYILDEGMLDKALEGTKNLSQGKKPERQYMMKLMINTSNNHMLSFQYIVY